MEPPPEEGIEAGTSPSSIGPLPVTGKKIVADKEAAFWGRNLFKSPKEEKLSGFFI